MKILFVTYRFPYPSVNHAGGVYVLNTILALKSRGIDVDLLSFINNDEIEYAESMKVYIDSMILIPSKKSFYERILDLIKYLYKPKFVVDAYQRKFINALIKMQKKTTYDIIQFEWTQMGQYISYVKNPNTVNILTEQDVSIIPIERDFYRQKVGFRKLKKLWTFILIKSYEPCLCAKFDMVFTLSKKDSDFLQNINPDIKTIEYPILIANDTQQTPIPDNKNILYLAHLGRSLNIEAVDWFYHNVFKDILDIYPDAEFTIVGAEPNERIYQIAKNKQVKLFANVEDIIPFYKNARVFVSPLRVGGGIIKKNLDSMALGCPLITTTIGNEGINAVDGHDVLIANTKDEFIEKLKKVFIDYEFCKHISENAKNFISDNFHFNKSIDRIILEYKSLINAKR